MSKIMQEVIMLMGFPASGKSSLAKEYQDIGYIKLSRDVDGGSYKDLAIRLDNFLSEKKKVVLDNTNFDKKSRRLFFDVIKKYQIKVKGVWLKTSIQNCKINACLRLMQYQNIDFNCSNKEFNKLFDPQVIKKSKNPNIFQPEIIHMFGKLFQPPSIDEGFDEIVELDFIRIWPSDYINKALILDYDGTLRTTPEHSECKVFPKYKHEIIIMPNRKESLQFYKDEGYIFAGISNQSGVHGGSLSLEDAERCFKHTNNLLGFDIDYRFCAHSKDINNCYCRKPNPLKAVFLIQKYKLDPKKCIFVGDQKSDKELAECIGFTYYDANDFFKEV